MAQDDLSDNEVDAFDSRNEQILLAQAGEYLNGGSEEEDSEEEVMGLKYQSQQDSEDSEEESDAGSEAGSESEEDPDDDERWGSKKNYYGGDDLSDDDAGKEMAEEALRQQKKHLQELQMDDFVDEEMMQDWKKTAQEHDAAEVPVLGATNEDVDLHNLDNEEKLKHLTGFYPEFIPLLTEFNTLAPQLETLKTAEPRAVFYTKYTALSAYLSSITSYFSMFVDKLRSQHNFSMKDSPVMESILSTREVWRQANELTDAERSIHLEDNEQASQSGDIEDVSMSEQEDLQTDSEDELSNISDADGAADANSVKDDLEINLLSKRSIRKPTNAAAAAGDYTETNAPDSIDREDKDRKKKSLRFYTSKIDQAAQKNAKKEKFDGDSDLPYRERLFERQQRLIEEARKRGLGKDKAQLGDDLDDNDIDSNDEQLAQEINADASEYYETIRQAKIDKKDARRAAHMDAKKAARDGKLAELQETIDKDGRRALNFQILKNKGLKPNRRNDNRNSRVKKRKKYDQAKKKLKSVRQVYEPNKGPYQGEKTGIKKGLSRSVKLR